MRLRTVDSAFKEIHEQDPDSAISKGFIRTAIVTGRVPSISQGRKRLFQMEDLYDYIRRELDQAAEDYQRMVEENLGRR